MYIFIKSRRKNTCLLFALLISSFEYLVPGSKFTFLFFELGFTFTIGKIGLGINFLGIILLIWYSMLKQEKVMQSQGISD